MSKLQKHAWVNLIVTCICVVISILLFYDLRRSNAQGLDFIVIMIIVGGLTGLPIFLFIKKVESKYDEREKAINKKAYVWATYAMMGYAFFVGFTAFLVIGGNGVLPVFYLPMFLFVGLFIGQLVQSAIILILLAREETDE
jgi:undecaprenyl pyrophosphate phosphatase UppP